LSLTPHPVFPHITHDPSQIQTENELPDEQYTENSVFCILQFTFNSSFYINEYRPIQGDPNRTIFLDRIRLILYEQDTVNVVSTMLISR
jgi:hypothetical protein